MADCMYLFSLQGIQSQACDCGHMCTCAGQPEFAVDVDNIKPKGLVVAAALAMLVLGKPLSGSRGFGGLQFALPKTGTCTAKVCTMHMLDWQNHCIRQLQHSFWYIRNCLLMSLWC